ncbi:ADL151Wp [Eremothecium gossypii ATCC 10895]|uniref:Peroxisomal protein PEX21 n=1 Tax=Eremothecium gossypii (strain ATCC 10895 / CBS 109.51 / FGSC 9923 / NRRL Y-1056) TaxID=284811 RepID=PEX21_EREGS|nr:ADL151Wp [Eremothecium gossypii ATCC 10895]Q75AS1.1 RecName: Full=Peroxisomal protein PEX21; AltName: Full=Peroxin-21 [Eremothecium gossypii ATCC 10895]AAS51769.1 ADL151Wp [Eremothecium gossypii ATCC 10895]
MSLCQGSAMQKLIAKTEGPMAGVGRVGGFNRPSGGLGQSSAEQQLQARAGERASQNRFMAVLEPQRELGGRMARGDGLQADWVRQFSSMQVEDPLAFSAEYQRAYAGYEQRQAARPAARVLGYGGSMFMPTMPQQQLQQQVAPQQTAQAALQEAELERYLEREFDVLEGELAPPEVPEALSAPLLDHEQLGFQESAKAIYATLSAPIHKDKFGASKFMGLMRQVSTGDVTLSKSESGYTGLHMTAGGEAVGAEYRAVTDEVVQVPEVAAALPLAGEERSLASQMEDLLNKVDIAGLSSNEAAMRILS